MPGLLALVDTQVEAPLLDVDRSLAWNSPAGGLSVLELYVPDQTVSGTGLRLVRAITRFFNRVTEDEGDAGASGKTVVFRVADFGYSEGQLVTDLALKDLQVRWILDGVPSEFCKVNEVTRPSEDVAQVYTVVAQTRAFKHTYFPR